MAYQSKKHRKFVATAVTAAVVASAVAPAAGFAAEKDFTDKIPTWADKAVDYLVGKGAIEGNPDGSFAPNKSLTRAQAAKILALSLDLKVDETAKSTFKDVKENHWAQSYIAAIQAQKAGVIDGDDKGNFNPEKEISREELAKMVVTAYGLKADESAILDFTDVSGWGAEFVNTLASLGVVEGVATGKFDPKGKVTRAQAAVFVHRAEVPAERKEVATSEAKVVSVSAINSKQVEVKFSQAVKTSTLIQNTTTGQLVANTVTVKRTVVDPNNGNKSVTLVSGKLSNDGKVLTLTADGGTFFDGTYSLTIADSVKTEKGETVNPYAGTLTASDKTAPAISKVDYNPSTGDLEITTSEPVTTAPDVLRINGTPVTGLSPVANSNNTKFKVAKPSSVAAGSTANVYLAGSADYAGNLLTPYNGSVVITDDQSALQVVSTTQVSSNVAKFVFNKSLNYNDTAIEGAISVLIDGQAVAAGNVDFELDTNDSSNKTIIATFESAYTAPNYFYGSASSKSVTFVFANDIVTDVFGKKLPTTTQTVTMNKDVTGPKAVSAQVSADGKYIEVTFDEVIQNVTAGASNSNVTVRKDGVAVDMTGGNVSISIVPDADGDNKVLKISPDNTATLAAGTYTVRLASGTVEDVHTNDSEVVSINTTKTSNVSNLTATIANLGATPVNNNKFKVTFSEAVGDSALVRTNYTLDGVVLPEGTDIYFADSDRKIVNIVLPTNSVNVGVVGQATAANNATLGVMNVSTTAGKVVVTNSGTVKVQDNTAAVLQNASLIGTNVLKLTFNENIAASFADVEDILDDIQISNGTSFVHGDSTHVASVSGKDIFITITPNTSNWSAATSGTVTVKTLSGGDTDIKDTNGLGVKANVSVTVSK